MFKCCDKFRAFARVNGQVKRHTQLKALGFLNAFEESADWALLSSFCDDSKL